MEIPTKTNKERMEAAIRAHFDWFDRLKTAIETGKSEHSPDVVADDSQCDFGNWLYSDFKDQCDDATFQKIKDIHAKFHKKASEVLNMALQGDIEEAKGEISLNSELFRLSGDFIWQLRQL